MSQFQALKNLVSSETNLVAGLFGTHGIGKTSLMKQLATELNRPLLIMNLAALEPSDFSGKCLIDSNGLTSFSKPKFLDFDGIIFLDEINRVHDMSVKACLNSLLLDKAINGHKLRDGSKIVVAGNTGDNYETSEFDPSLNSRIIRIEFKPTLENWIDRERQVNPSPLVEFVASVPDLVKQFDFRRLSEANIFYVSAKTHVGLEYILNHSLVDLFNESLHKNNLKFSDILDNDLSKLPETAKVRLTMLAHESARFILSDKSTKDSLESIRQFIIKIDNESKLTFFSDIKSASDTLDPKIFKPIVDRLKAAKFFESELKDYLKTIFNRE